jgi:hypothetical protein
MELKELEESYKDNIKKYQDLKEEVEDYYGGQPDTDCYFELDEICNEIFNSLKDSIKLLKKEKNNGT